MAKFDYRKLEKTQRDKILLEIAASLQKLGDATVVQQFLQQLLTPSEIAMIGRRWQVAKMLLQEKSYYEIRSRLGVGFSTIESVDRWLRKSIDHYPALIAALRGDTATKKREFRKRYGSTFGSLESLRHRYPLHFLLLNMVLGK